MGISFSILDIKALFGYSAPKTWTKSPRDSVLIFRILTMRLSAAGMSSLLKESRAEAWNKMNPDA